jgi:hypothetical protein
MAVKLLIVDELGYVPLSPTGAEPLFEEFSQRYERGSTIVTSNLPFEDWTQVLASERLTGTLLDRPPHHASILTMNGGSYGPEAVRRAPPPRRQRKTKPGHRDHRPGDWRNPHLLIREADDDMRRAPIEAFLISSARAVADLLLLRRLAWDSTGVDSHDASRIMR